MYPNHVIELSISIMIFMVRSGFQAPYIFELSNSSSIRLALFPRPNDCAWYVKQDYSKCRIPYKAQTILVPLIFVCLFT